VCRFSDGLDSSKSRDWFLGSRPLTDGCPDLLIGSLHVRMVLRDVLSRGAE
jgi:hypothetical protein